MPPLRTFVTFVLVGPPLGWLIYAIGVTMGDAKPGGSLLALVAGVPALLLGLPFSYAYGIIPALLVAMIMVASGAAQARSMRGLSGCSAGSASHCFSIAPRM